MWSLTARISSVISDTVYAAGLATTLRNPGVEGERCPIASRVSFAGQVLIDRGALTVEKAASPHPHILLMTV